MALDLLLLTEHAVDESLDIHRIFRANEIVASSRQQVLFTDEDKEAVFRPFVSRRPGGTGLGLAIVRQIVENHKGTIRETGKVGEGARFEIELPALPDEEMSDEGAGD